MIILLDISLLNTSKSINVIDIEKIIHDFKPKTSTGHDRLSMKLIKCISLPITHPLTLIINQSLNTGIFPKKLKLAKVLPVYKKNDNNILDNYRPISLLPALSKIVEKVVCNQLYSYFNTYKLLHKSQHGFRKLHSTETAAFEFIDRISNVLDSGELPIAIFLDLSKAFDTLDHSIILHKLIFYGITGTPMNWFKSCFGSRLIIQITFIQITVMSFVKKKSNLSRRVVGLLGYSI